MCVGLKVQRAVTESKQYFGALHLTKHYLLVSTNIKVRWIYCVASIIKSTNALNDRRRIYIYS